MTPTVIIYGLLILIPLLVYYQVIDFGFILFDDPTYVTENSMVLSGLNAKSIYWAFSEAYQFNWHPITWLSHMLDIELFGLNAGYHHLVNVLIHILNTLILFKLLYKTTGYLWRCAFIAGLFALHPLHVESVVWISERKDVLSTFFYFWALWSYQNYTQAKARANHHAIVHYGLVIVLLVFGLLTKPMLVTLPFLLLVLDYWPLNRVKSHQNQSIIGFIHQNSHLIKEKFPLFILIIIVILITFSVENIKPIETFSITERLSNSLISYTIYIEKTFWPSDLIFYYPYPEHFSLIHISISATILLFITYLSLRWLTDKPWFFVGWFWFLGTLIPVIGLVQIGSQAWANRYSYVPMTGLTIIIVWLVCDWASKKPKKALLLSTSGSLILLLCSWLSYYQIDYWSSSEKLFNHALDVNSNNYKARNNLGLILQEKGKLKEAMVHFKLALALKPDDIGINANIGNILIKQKQYQQAKTYLLKALQINLLQQDQYQVDAEDAYNNLGIIYNHNKEFNKALSAYQHALTIKPNYIKALINIGATYIQTKQYDKAINSLEKAIDLKANSSEVYANLGSAYYMSGNYRRAENYYSKALEITPNNALIQNNLANTFFLQKKFTSAIHYFKLAKANSTYYIQALIKNAQVLAKNKHFDKAIENYLTVTSLKPKLTGIYYRIASLYAQQGNQEKTLHWLQQAEKYGFTQWQLIKNNKQFQLIRQSALYKKHILSQTNNKDNNNEM